MMVQLILVTILQKKIVYFSLRFVKNFAQNDVTFSLNKNSQNNSQNCQNNFLVSGEGSSYEKKKKEKIFKFTKSKTKFLSMLEL